MAIRDFTVGVDPEIFLTLDGKAVSAYGLIEGSKEKPFPVPSGAYQVDGTAVEFNTDPVPLNDFTTFNAKMVTVMKELQKAVSAKGDYKFNISPVQDYDQEYLDSLPDESKELGCDPDYNAYTMEENPRPDGERPFRTGAGHIHVGWGADIPVENREHHEICAGFVKMLDATVGLFMTCIDRDPRRRELYGKAGAYRAKPYGVEYRFPSNVWIQEKVLRRAVHILVGKAVNYMEAGYSVRKITGQTEEQIRYILDNGDAILAKQVLRKSGIIASYDVIWAHKTMAGI